MLFMLCTVLYPFIERHAQPYFLYVLIRQIRGRAIVIAQPWEDLKKLLREEYCPDNAIKKFKEELQNHVMNGADVDKCGLELESHTSIIDLSPFGHGSFDVIVGMDWLSNLRAKIVCFEKIVQIMLSNGDILEVHGEHLLGLPPSREVEFRIDLIPGAMPVVKSHYRLEPTEMKELSNQLEEL
uniref:Reverse transcriptase domain-containing protein n=1 Tax=Tanacetum cinerariifolium TaxID=118510 RepID=A0A699I4H7_TANCI|nr:reverse transcriptase domain-containing protein [Tanacetum cinerariifolium]